MCVFLRPVLSYSYLRTHLEHIDAIIWVIIASGTNINVAILVLSQWFNVSETQMCHSDSHLRWRFLILLHFLMPILFSVHHCISPHLLIHSSHHPLLCPNLLKQLYVVLSYLNILLFSLFYGNIFSCFALPVFIPSSPHSFSYSLPLSNESCWSLLSYTAAGMHTYCIHSSLLQ